MVFMTVKTEIIVRLIPMIMMWIIMISHDELC